MIVRSRWNRKLLPRREEERLLCKSDQDACGGNYNYTPKKNIREFKQIATATSTTAVVDAVSWGEYVS